MYDFLVDKTVDIAAREYHAAGLRRSLRLSVGIWSWSFSVLDHQDVDRTSSGDEFEAELFAKRFDYGCPGGIA